MTTYLYVYMCYFYDYPSNAQSSFLSVGSHPPTQSVIRLVSITVTQTKTDSSRDCQGEKNNSNHQIEEKKQEDAATTWKKLQVMMSTCKIAFLYEKI